MRNTSRPGADIITRIVSGRLEPQPFDMDLLSGVDTPPRITSVCPSVATWGPYAGELAAYLGVPLDDWQQAVLDCWLAMDELGHLPVTVGLTVPRQSGKSTLLLVREVWSLLRGETVASTAHQVKTASAHFDRLMSVFGYPRDPRPDHPELNRLVRRAVGGDGRQMLDLTTGGSLFVQARQRGAARGRSVDLLTLDEAQDIGEDTMSALSPTTSASPNAQVLWTGTVPGPHDDGVSFARVRDIALDGGAPGLMWSEWSPDPGADLEAEETLAATNPGLYRMNRASIDSERVNLSPEAFARERLGLWPVAGQRESVFDLEAWDRCRAKRAPSGDRVYAVCLDDGRMAVVGAVVTAEKIHLEVIPAAWTSATALAEWLADWRRWPQVKHLAVFGAGGSILIDNVAAEVRLSRARVRDMTPHPTMRPISENPSGPGWRRQAYQWKTNEYVGATRALVDAVTSGRISHSSPEGSPLDAAIREATLDMRGRWQFEDATLKTVLDAATIAFAAAVPRANWLATRGHFKQRLL